MSNWYSSRFCENTEAPFEPDAKTPSAEKQADPPKPKAKVQSWRRKKKQDTQETAAE